MRRGTGFWVAAALAATACAPRPERLRVEPTAPRLFAKGATVPLRATAVDGEGRPVPGVAIIFESKNPGVATVRQTGVVTAVRSGKATVIVSGGGTSQAVNVTVSIPSSLAVVPEALTLVGIGAGGDLGARVKDENGDEVPDQTVGWSSSNPSVVSVAGGKLAARGMGQADIVAVAGALRATASIQVDEPPFESIRIDSPRIVVRAGEQTAVPARALDAQGAVVPGAGFDYAVDDTDVATVDGRGMVHGVARGKTRLAVSAGAHRSEVDVEVLPPRKGK